jgi:hypothetical protein
MTDSTIPMLAFVLLPGLAMMVVMIALDWVNHHDL